MPYIYCSFCGSREHNLPLCPKTWGGSFGCGFCGSKKHKLDYCPKTNSGQLRRMAGQGVRGSDYID